MLLQKNIFKKPKHFFLHYVLLLKENYKKEKNKPHNWYCSTRNDPYYKMNRVFILK